MLPFVSVCEFKIPSEVDKLLALAHITYTSQFLIPSGWSGGAMVLGKLPVPGRPTIWMIVGEGPFALTVGTGGGLIEHFTLRYLFTPLSRSFSRTRSDID